MFRALKELFGPDILLQEVVADFERACWRAIHEVFPRVKIFGCGFHWTQAVFRNIKRFGLATLYSSNRAVRVFLRRMMCLHLMPRRFISELFDGPNGLVSQVPSLNLDPLERAQMDRFLAYMEAQWIRNAFWEQSRWCVFMQIIRTNNDCEGWHFRINGRAHVSGMNFYELVSLLFDEAQDIPMERERVVQQMSSRRQRSEYAEMQEMLQAAWGSFNDGDETPQDLLAGVADLFMEKTTLRFERDLDDDREEELEEDELDEDAMARAY